MYYIYILHTITYAIYMYIYSKYYYKVTTTMPYIIYSINFSSDYSIDTLMHIHFLHTDNSNHCSETNVDLSKSIPEPECFPTPKTRSCTLRAT